MKHDVKHGVKHANADMLLVLGAGPAGLAAAHAASAQGQAVTLVDDNGAPGGQIWRGGPAQWTDPRAHALWRALRERANVRFIDGARIVSTDGPKAVLIESDEHGAERIAWRRLIVCSGARELLLPFPGWTLPGVTGAGGMQALIKGGMPVEGKRVLVAGTGPLLLAVADTVRRHRGHVVTLAEHRSTRDLTAFFLQLAREHRAKAWQALCLLSDLAGTRYRHGATVLAAHGDTRLRSVTLRHRGRTLEIACDFLACGFGLVPSTELAGLLGCDLREGRVSVDAAQRTSRSDVWAAGEVTGIGGVDKALAEGRIAGLAATGQAATPAELLARTKTCSFGTLLARSFAPAPSLREICRSSTLVCRCEDVSAAQLSAHADWRSAKLQTRAGMGPCQGRICGAACEFLFGWPAPGVRQPIFPTSATTLAGAACNEDEQS